MNRRVIIHDKTKECKALARKGPLVLDSPAEKGHILLDLMSSECTSPGTTAEKVLNILSYGDSEAFKCGKWVLEQKLVID